MIFFFYLIIVLICGVFFLNYCDFIVCSTIHGLNKIVFNRLTHTQKNTTPCNENEVTYKFVFKCPISDRKVEIIK